MDDSTATPSPDSKDPADSPSAYVTSVEYWVNQIDAANKREENWKKEARKHVQMYECDEPEENTYNILYSNTETMAPALYNSTPQPIVKRRFDDEDPLGEQASKAGERILKYLCDDGMSEDATFDELMMSAVLEALVPGRGVTRFKFDAVIGKRPKEPAAPKSDDPNAQHSDLDEYVESETVCGVEVPWDHFLHGYGRKWKDVPWVAFYEPMTREELIENFPECGHLVDVSSLKDPGADNSQINPGLKNEQGMENVKVADTWQIWDKSSRKVISICPTYKDKVLKVVDDPLQLTGYFPCPKPLMFVQRISSLVPVPLYKTYQEQARELNRVTMRINKIVNAMKVRGLYDGTVKGLDRLLELDDNEFAPADNVAALLNNGKLDQAIWIWPLADLVAVLQQLYNQRVQVKTVIYELTGIADIMRGSSQASETLGAQELKNQWGTLRLKRNQKAVARYARDSLRIMEEIAVSKLSVNTIKGMTGLPYPMQSEKEQAQQLSQVMQQVGAPVPPPVQAILSQPSFDDLIALLRNDVSRSYRIDIETNSTIDAEATQDKEDINELMTAISQFLTGVGPLIQDGTLPFQIAQSMLLVIVRRFRFGPEIEDMLKQMQPPQPKPDPAMIKAQTDKAASDQQMQQDGQKHAADMELKGIDAQTKQKQSEMDLEAKRSDHQFKMADLQQKGQFNERQHQLKMQQLEAQTHATVITAHAQAKAAAAKPAPGSSKK